MSNLLAVESMENVVSSTLFERNLLCTVANALFVSFLDHRPGNVSAESD